MQSEGGMHLALALWSRSGVLLELNSGAAALSDLQYSLECGLPAKQHGAYYLRLARANASELNSIFEKFTIENHCVKFVFFCVFVCISDW